MDVKQKQKHESGSTVIPWAHWYIHICSVLFCFFLLPKVNFGFTAEAHCLSSAQTRILVTHGVSFLPHVDEIVVLQDGVVSEVGSYNSLRASRGAFSEFLDTYAKEQSNQTKSESGNYTFSCHCIMDISCTSY